MSCTCLPSIELAAGLRISQLGFGTAEIGNLYRRIGEPEAQNALAAAWTSGITLYDTAPGYGAGLSELRLGAFLRDRVGSVVVTKIGRSFRRARGQPNPTLFTAPLPFDGQFDYSYDGVMRSFEHSTLRLGLAHIDMLLVHDLDRRNHGDQLEHHYRILMESGLRALQELQRSGDVKLIGIAVNEPEIGVRMLNDGKFDVALLASRYTLIEQGAAHDFFPAAVARNVKVLAGGVFNSGILASGAEAGATYDYVEAGPEIIAKVRRLGRLCNEWNVSLPGAAMQFTAAHPAVAAILTATSRAERVAPLVAQFTTPIPAGFWAELRQSGLLDPAALLPA